MIKPARQYLNAGVGQPDANGAIKIMPRHVLNGIAMPMASSTLGIS
ncbi:MAG: hypothetical protein U5L05_01315 [Rubrivivax sp.]|nr:hypothetical protein [Rubrivivax sp.]